MTNKETRVCLPLDGDDFLSRECPYCKMRFKIHRKNLKKNKKDNSVRDIYCPYCGQTAKSNEFWTQKQIAYLKKSAECEFVEPELKKVQNYLKQLETQSEFLSIKVKSNMKKSSKPVPPEETNNMEIFTFPCCGLQLKIDKTWQKEIHRISCGKPQKKKI